MSVQEIKIYSEAGYLIPLEVLSKETVESAQKKCLYRFYKEAVCAKCEWLEDRHSENCASCPAFVGARQTVKKVVYKNKEFLSIPRGRKSLAVNVAMKDNPKSELRIVSTSKDVSDMSEPMSLKPEAELRVYQEEAVAACFKHRRGIIKSPPRSGKTLIGTAFICKVGKKALILASQREWLVQFKETFYGSKTQVGFTDAKPGKVDFARNYEDFLKLDVCLCTFAQFMSAKGKSLLERIRSLFGVIMVDECHKTPALATSKVLSAFNAKYAIGLSGTPKRKIEKEMLVANDLLGPIIYEAKIPRMRPSIQLLDTPGEYEYNRRTGKAALTNLQSKLENNKARRTKIVKHAIKMAMSGHLVMIPLTRVNAILEWTRQINEITERRGFALPFYGGVPKDLRVKIIDKLRNYKARIVVGNISMLSTGLNIPRASCLIDSTISSNLPNAEQRFARILTPMEGKPAPVIVFTLDNCDFMKGCRRNEYFNALLPEYNPRVDPTVRARLLEYFSSKDGSGGRADFFKDI